MKSGYLIILKTGAIVEFLRYGPTIKIYEVCTLEDRFGQKFKSRPYHINSEHISEHILEIVK